MWEYVVHFDAHVASQIFEGSQYFGDEFCIVAGFVAKE